MRRAPTALGLVLGLLLLVEAAAVVLHDEARPYAPEQALEQFRAQTSAPSPGGPRASPPAASGQPAPVAVGRAPGPAVTNAPRASSAPRGGITRSSAPSSGQEPTEVEPGVYSYATQGHEEVDALGGARHDYPARSAITYRRGGCGDVDEWQPLQGRISTNTVCRGPSGLEPRRTVQRREFFGQSETQDLVCRPGFVLIPDDPRPGTSSTGECRSSDSVARLTVRVIDTPTVVVGGERVRVVHVKVTGTLTGKTRGTTEREEWFTPGGLLVRAIATSDTDADTAGGVVHYTESFTLGLESLRPQR